MHTFIGLTGIFFTAFIVGLSGAMMPGPLLAVTVSETSRRGAKAGPLLVLGHMLLEALLVAAVALGLAGFLKSPTVIGVVGLAGGLMMGWMGQDMLRSARSASIEGEARRRTTLHPVAAGVLVSLSNPYWTIWWATIGMAYVLTGLRFGAPGIIAFFAGHILADLGWYSAVSFGLSRGHGLLTERAYRRIVAVCGSALIAFGGWFLWNGVCALMA